MQSVRYELELQRLHSERSFSETLYNLEYCTLGKYYEIIIEWNNKSVTGFICIELKFKCSSVQIGSLPKLSRKYIC